MRTLQKRIAAVLVLLLICTGCAPAASGNTAAPVAEPVTLVYGSDDVTAVNPAIFEHGELNPLLFNGLTARDGANKVIPGLAERWEYDDAAQSYTFHLREGVRWHDGEAFTSADVKFTLEAIKDPANASEIASNYAEIDQIETPDPQTVVLHLSQPNVALLDYLSVGILPAHLLEGKPLMTDGFNQAPVGNGPYRLGKWEFGQSITLERNDDYFGAKPQIERIIFKIVPDTRSRVLQLFAGEIDMAQIPPQDARSVEKDERFHLYEMQTADYRAVLYNFHYPLFEKHPELPALFELAFDRQGMTDGVLLGYGEPAYAPLQKGAYAPATSADSRYDPDGAKAALESAGWIAGADGVRAKQGERLAFTLHAPEGDSVRIDLARLAAQQLREVGAEVDVAIDAQVDWANQAAYLIGWGSPYDPDDHTYKVFGTDQGSNLSGYSNAQVDELLLTARQTADEAERLRLYQAFQAELEQNPAYSMLVYAEALYAADKRLEGIDPEMVLAHHGVGIFWNVSEWTFS